MTADARHGERGRQDVEETRRFEPEWPAYAQATGPPYRQCLGPHRGGDTGEQCCRHLVPGSWRRACLGARRGGVASILTFATPRLVRPICLAAARERSRCRPCT